MRAALLTSTPGVLDVTDVTVDEPRGSEVLVRTVSSGLCHSDLHLIDGVYGVTGADASSRILLGHEAAGVVEAVGDQVRLVRQGDHVITFPMQSCGRCPLCDRGRPTLCERSPGARHASEPPRLTQDGHPVIQFSNLGAFAEFMLVDETALVAIRPDYPFERAAIIGCGVATGIGAVLNTARVRGGSTVAVVGLGGVGLAVVQGARLAGAERIIAVDTEPGKFALATRLGATDCVDASSTDPVAAVLDVAAGGVDHAFEAIGLPATMEQSVRMLRRGGVATFVGVGQGRTLELDAGLFLYERRLQGSLMGSCRLRIDLPRFVALDLAGRLDLGALVESTIRLDEINDGYEAMRRRAIVGRRVIMFD
jgi:S-(hydroxymethyl)glutathione dehydrogenase / alcohol dehydrogenase